MRVVHQSEMEIAQSTLAAELQCALHKELEDIQSCREKVCSTPLLQWCIYFISLSHIL